MRVRATGQAGAAGVLLVARAYAAQGEASSVGLLGRAPAAVEARQTRQARAHELAWRALRSWDVLAVEELDS